MIGKKIKQKKIILMQLISNEIKKKYNCNRLKKKKYYLICSSVSRMNVLMFFLFIIINYS
jgi:hypothetical protein